MDILKTAVDWTKAEVLSSSIFVLAGVAFLVASFGFWQLGKTDLARAYVIPTIVSGALLLVIGLGIMIPSILRVNGFADAYSSDPTAFIAAELTRTEAVLNQYRIAVYRVIPLIVAACAGALLVIDTPLWRASLITTIGLMAIVLIIDSNANAHLERHHANLQSVAKPD